MTDSPPINVRRSIRTLRRRRAEDDDPQASLRRSMRLRRRQLGLTQEDVARLLGVSRLTYNRMEADHERTDRRRMDFRMIARICDVFNLSVDDLIDDRTVSRAYRTVATRMLEEAST